MEGADPNQIKQEMLGPPPNELAGVGAENE